MRKRYTSESVTEGHPDKMCDQISDGILDAIISRDLNARVACETVVTTGMVLVMGEISTDCYVDIPKEVRKIIAEIGYKDKVDGFDASSCAVLTSLDEQSADIAMGVDRSLENKGNTKDDRLNRMGAGDQGMMVGYACRDTKDYMPLSASLAQALVQKLAKTRKEGTLSYLRPDGKAQVSVVFEDDKPLRIDSVVLSTQHDAEVSLETIRQDMIREVIRPVLPEDLVDKETRFLVNPTGRFVTGGPQGDSGLTGRKIIVDTYGGLARHGGGAFSGKDPTKVDRSAAYAARHVAKNLVAAGLADRCEVELAYAIGVACPVSIRVDSFGTSSLSEEALTDLVRAHFDLRPAAIIENFNLRRPIYRQLAAYGHFGRPDLDLPWERLDKIEELKKAAKK